ncbi:16S rRNA (cytosine(1402)-N(4))-methyltransferase RsmH [Clavibacter michiganensis]|uniref:Ribosomal RNA small subunit methyltransferase H n=1 Tax=Clavibacter michiganensis subsp. michiganensis (strain NCPPB 382) TaxID=443906 RepID=RSMH_CLAM3|nr:16S rRNA (cytosine(1402)-N(4))-methyltransferase RsmH [Clavibacter michiganensis]A5CS59.1 RecName: Full=Ribosomal RNA small subunit methyltransferase H; AltName: Full=16S rRNA m(4)C1402 methyltransferase; AltName: Full=rRNA (cytosine-N(4)-)-methyltransferase RsmH [Clavibacter michiganensis subsp. michiganensis NCPPB 382]MDO4017819.1 16S rRNA (cytosine(1402)-N(4))-methyltransferase RsmH [Clavibacter michiganensis]MDO4032445.1 16S rRNA (cytosine(1402)-N(4))-methyltransferase RsmH [Clavibacter m
MALDDIHTPVLLERCLELLAPALQGEGAVLVDATLGMAGHSEAFLDALPGLRLVGLDRDPDALAIAGERLARFGDRVNLVHTVYDGIGRALDGLGIGEVQGVFFDLGVSSLQLDRVERGFSYSQDAPLDMRMDGTAGLTAAQVVAEYDELELRRIFYDYGEEKLAPRYASRIVQAREVEPITTSARLVEIIQQATPAAVQRAGHPAKRVFQALRIEVNQELSVLARAMPAAVDRLAVGGRVVVESYQSLEDRIVKRELRARSTSTAPVGLPVELPEHRPELKLLVRGAELADQHEIAQNPRAASVRLRAAERARRRHA